MCVLDPVRSDLLATVACAEMAEHVSEYAEAALSAARSSVRRRHTRRDTATSPPSAEQAQQQPLNQLHNFDSLPDYLRDNEFIQTGYRYNLPVKDTLKSFFNLHNETGNIWSHFIGFVLFLFLTVWMVNSPPTPVVLARPHLEHLWRAVSSNMQELTGTMGHNLQQMHLPRLPKALQDSWHSGMNALQALEHTLQDRVHGLQESFQDRVHTLQESVQESVHSLQESVHNLQGQVQSGAMALAGQLQHGLSTLMHEGWAAGDAMRSAATNWPPKQLLAALAGSLQWPTPRWPMYVFCAGAMSCLLLSAFCHLMGCCQQHITMFIWRLDYTGIALLIVSSFYPTVYYSFLCHPYASAVYLTIITVLGAAAVAMSLLEVFQQSHWRTTRAMLYVGLGCIGVVPLMHVMALHSDVWHVRTFVFRDVLMGISYLSGAAIYAMRVPERWFPGKFDIFLHSHQLFHICVVLGAYLHWRAALLLLEWRDASGGCAMPVIKGPLNQVIAELSSHGHDLLAIDQVWEGLRLAAGEHIAQLMTGADGGAPQAAYPAV